jgi:vancomycin resistance protein YoaR
VQRADSEPEPSAPPSHKRRRPHARRAVIGSAIVLLIVVPASAVVAWQLDESRNAGRVSRAVTVAGSNVSGDSPAELRTTLLSLQQRIRSESIDIGHDGQRFTARTADIALDLDVDRTQIAVLEVGHDEAPPRRFFRWLGSHFSNDAGPVHVTFDEAKLNVLITENDPGPRTQPNNPTIAFRDGKFEPVEGADGHGLMNAEGPAAIRAAVKKGFPLSARVSAGNLPAINDTGDLDEVIRDAELVTTSALNVSAENKQAVISVEQLRPLMRASASGDHLRLDVDATEATKLLSQLLPDAGTKPVEAGYNVIDDKPVVVDGKPGTTCCDDSAASVLRDALMTRKTGADPNTTVQLPMKTVNPNTTAADVPDLGIKEKIASFTTYHPRNQPRVKNIHLISDLTRGSVVKPGEMFSINNAVGKRTVEKGFVVDHVIEDGKFKDDVGGGISQYATTLFNAAFFGGLDFGEYQSHSIYIDRYPYGREATVSFPHPDMQVKNTTPYGLLIWPTYTDNSLTISLYSTKFATGEQTAQTTGPAGKCTRVRTERTRTYVDGRAPVKDTVGALYQPKEGERC